MSKREMARDDGSFEEAIAQGEGKQIAGFVDFFEDGEDKLLW
jgi:hypothetical protein